MDDAELVNGLLRGEARYQLALLDRYQARLAEYMLRFDRLVANDAEDIAAEVLDQLVLNPQIIDLSKGRGELDGLVFKMAKNRTIDRLRKIKRSLDGKRVVSLDTHSDMLERISDDDVRVVGGRTDRTSDGPESSISDELAVETRQLLDSLQLSPNQLEHLRLRVEEKLKPKEIAKFLGIKEGNERVRWHRLGVKIERAWRKYPHIVEYGKEIGALDPKEDIPDSGSEIQTA